MSNQIPLDERFWDCECVEHYIKPKTIKFCSSCQTHQADQPDSVAEEVFFYFPEMREPLAQKEAA